jgi:hypothetical protein
MSYLDNELIVTEPYVADDDSDLDSHMPMSEEELQNKFIDEEYTIVTNMYNNLKDYIDNKPYLFPIMNILNQNNFDLWFSQHLYPKQIIAQPKKTKSKRKNKNQTF